MADLHVDLTLDIDSLIVHHQVKNILEEIRKVFMKKVERYYVS